MGINLGPIRTSLLLLLVTYFWYMEGFTKPEYISRGLQEDSVAEAWMRCVLMYLGGAVAATIIDHQVGTMDRTNLRPVYIIVGIALMAGSLLWLDVLKETVALNK